MAGSSSEILVSRFRVNGVELDDYSTLLQRFRQARKAGGTRETAIFAATHDRAAFLVQHLANMLAPRCTSDELNGIRALISEWIQETDEFIANNGK